MPMEKKSQLVQPLYKTVHKLQQNMSLVPSKVQLLWQIKNQKDQLKSTHVLVTKIVILDRFIQSVVTYSFQKYLWQLAIGAPNFGWMI